MDIINNIRNKWNNLTPKEKFIAVFIPVIGTIGGICIIYLIVLSIKSYENPPLSSQQNTPNRAALSDTENGDTQLKIYTDAPTDAPTEEPIQETRSPSEFSSTPPPIDISSIVPKQYCGSGTEYTINTKKCSVERIDISTITPIINNWISDNICYSKLRLFI